MKLSLAATLLCLSPLAQGCLLPEESMLESVGLVRRQANNNTGIPIGTGDRFQGGKIAPRGLGTQAPGTDLKTLLSVKEIESAFKGLAKEYGIKTFTSPYKTYEKNSIFIGQIGGRGSCPRVFFNAAIHARERGSSDNLLYFLGDLLYANKKRTSLVYGGRTYTYKDVQKALDAGIVFIPLSNPDGVAWDQKTNTCWRKNRNPEAATPGVPGSIGIDLNRNFDFLWDFPKVFTPTVAPNVASNNPRAQTYHGKAPFSEPESKSIKWVMDTFKQVRWFMDIHSYIGVVLYSWGSDENQANDKKMNFLNKKYNEERGLMPDAPSDGLVYAEYVPSKDWADITYAAMRTGNAMDATTGRHYEVEQAAYLYPTSGASDDYSYSRHFANPKLNKIHGFTIEFGFGNEEASCPFYPTPEQYHQNLLETSAGFMEFLLSASEIGLGSSGRC